MSSDLVPRGSPCSAVVVTVVRTMPLINCRYLCRCRCLALMREKELTFVYLVLPRYERNRFSAGDLNEGVWQGSLLPSVWYLTWSNANIKSLNFYINIGFMEIEIALSQPCHLLLYWFSSFGKSLVHFYCDSRWCLFISHLTLTGLPVRSLSIVSASGRMMHGECLGPSAQTWVLGSTV